MVKTAEAVKEASREVRRFVNSEKGALIINTAIIAVSYGIGIGAEIARRQDAKALGISRKDLVKKVISGC